MDVTDLRRLHQYMQSHTSNSLKTFRDIISDGLDETLTGFYAGPGDVWSQAETFGVSGVKKRVISRNRFDRLDIQACSTDDTLIYDFG